ncbi:hypothetical protein FA13DRAFT_1796980 [Coprinellus micaceus]|uniref:Uncharacterized protein n=1 Tax=Coprinellus micaceus TaxID=71717 RepID=A0A4Y7SSE9_COPMI|nr:hypothetical protein FA13DRAFT_1796980 [Coprinellus micaceus]
MAQPPFPGGPSLTHASTHGDILGPPPQKASTYLLISLIFAGPTCFLTFFSLFDTLFSHDGWPTCNPNYDNPLICGIPLVSPALAFITSLFVIVILYKLRRWMKSMVASTSQMPAAEGRSLSESTPLLGAVAQDEPPDSSEDAHGSPPLPHSLIAWTWLFAALWAVLSVHVLINVTVTIAPGSTWKPFIAREWCLLLPPHILQVWMLSITALELARLRSEGVQPVEINPPHQSSFVAKVQKMLVVSLILLSLSLILAEAHLTFFRLFVVTLIFDVTVLSAMDIRATRRPPTSTSAPSHYYTLEDPETGPIVLKPPRRTFFALVTACAGALALLWLAWSILTIIGATLSLLREALPDWEIIRLPIPDRGWAAWVWLEAVVDLWQGCALGSAALYSRKVVLARA